MDKGGYMATCAEVEVDATSKVRIVRVIQAWNSGAIVNPDGLRNQNVGAIVQGIGGALFEAIQFADGHILNAHFADYRLPRYKDTPEVEIVLINRKDLPSAGAGETGLVGIAPSPRKYYFRRHRSPPPKHADGARQSHACNRRPRFSS